MRGKLWVILLPAVVAVIMFFVDPYGPEVVPRSGATTGGLGVEPEGVDSGATRAVPRAKASSRLRGVISDGHGPIAGLLVILFGPDGVAGHERTAADGSYQLDFRAERGKRVRCELSVASSVLQPRDTRNIEVVGGTTTTLDVKLPTWPRVRGTLRIMDGGNMPQQAELTAITADRFKVSGSTSVFADGRFEICVPEAGSYRLMWKGSGYKLQCDPVQAGGWVYGLLWPACGVQVDLVDVEEPRDSRERHDRWISLHVRFESDRGDIFEKAAELARRPAGREGKFSLKWRRPEWWTAKRNVTVTVQGQGKVARALPVVAGIPEGQFDTFVELPVLTASSGFRLLHFLVERGGERFADPLLRVGFVGSKYDMDCHVVLQPDGLYRAYVPPGSGMLTLRQKGLAIGSREFADDAELGEAVFELAAPGTIEVTVPADIEPERVSLGLTLASDSARKRSGSSWLMLQNPHQLEGIPAGRWILSVSVDRGEPSVHEIVVGSGEVVSVVVDVGSRRGR